VPNSTPIEAPPPTPAAHGGSLFSARFKSNPEDFCVSEQLNIDFSGAGEHLYLHVEKTGRNTSDLVKGVSRCFGVPKKDIGTAGMKDKHAVTSQWLSVLTPQNEEPLVQWLATEGAPPFRLLDSARHSKKLRSGAHTGNRFVIRLNDVQPMEPVRFKLAGSADVSELTNSAFQEAISQRVQQLVNHGFPNYYGPQRFGNDGNNITAAIKWLTASEKIPSMAREKRSFYLSAVRSAAFNRVLAARVQAGTWNTLRSGDVCVLDGTRSVFTATDEDFDATQIRIEAFDVHPGARLIGDGEFMSTGVAKAADDAVLKSDTHYDALVKALCKLRMDASHRATRALCKDLSHRWIDNKTLEICVGLTPGVFATTLLAELFTERFE